MAERKRAARSRSPKRKTPPASPSPSRSPALSRSAPVTVKKKKAAPPPDSTPQPEQRGRQFIRRDAVSAKRRASLGSPSSRDRANAPLSRDPSPPPTPSRSKRGRPVPTPAALTRDEETLKEAPVSDEEDLEAGEESITPPVVSSPKRPKKQGEFAAEGSDADDEEESSSDFWDLKKSKPQSEPKLSLKPMKRSKGKSDLQESGGKSDSQRKIKKTLAPPPPNVSKAIKLKVRNTTNSQSKLVPRKKEPNYRGLGTPGKPAPPDRRTTAEALQEARKKRIRIVQFGGGTGSNAGDAALTSFLGSRRRATTDLGGGVAQSGALTSELSNIKAVDPADSDNSEADTASESEAAESASEEVVVLSEEEEEANTNIPAPANKKKSKQLLIVTHWHEDHAGDPKTLWQSEAATENIAALLGSKGATEETPRPTLIYGQRGPTSDYKDLADTLPSKQINEPENGKKLFGWKTKSGKVKKDLPEAGQLRVEGRVIRPPNVTLKMKMDKKKKETKPDVQNTESLGMLTIVDKYGDLKEGDSRGKERLFTMVSLGDMDGLKKAGKAQVAHLVKEVKDTYGQGFPIDVVKISHHGSEFNLDVIPDGLIGKDTVVVISGYTKTEPKDLIAKIDSWPTKKVILLLQDEGARTKLAADMGGRWTALTNKVTVANNLVMTVDDDGSVNIEATAFD